MMSARFGIVVALGLFVLQLFGGETVGPRVEHSPRAPRAGEKVAVRLSRAGPLDSAVVEYQVVLPGNYISLKDAAYRSGWVQAPMKKAAGAEEWSAEIPSAVQTHRALVRYRIHARAGGKALDLPGKEDAQPNYAYFVYDGVPGWKAAIDPSSWDPRKRGATEFTSQVMSQIQSYFLIARLKEVESATWYQQSFDKEYRYTGTVVADGQVYDHVPFRARGGVWRYSMGKNMWKFNFNKGHHLEARDDYGTRYHAKWGKLNLRSVIQQGDYGRRGEQGMYEAVGFRLFNLAGVEAPRTHWVSLRIVAEKEEAPADQYHGDFWGLYLAIENEDDDFLREHGLPDGNVYKMMFGQGQRSHQGQGQPTDGSDLQPFLQGIRRGGSAEAWWRKNVDLPRYYSYRSIIEAIHHYDVSDGKNYDFYFNPQTGKWQAIPWDIDLTWGDHMYGGGRDPFLHAVVSLPALRLEYQNRLREVRDLLFNPSETGRLIDECAALIHRPGAPSIVDADRMKWDYHPIMASRYVMPSKSGKGLFYQSAATHDFAGMVAQMKEYVAHRADYIDRVLLADPAVPAAPSAEYAGPAGYPADRLAFKAKVAADQRLAALEWRAGQVDGPGRADQPKRAGHYEISTVWQSGELRQWNEPLTMPAGALQSGATYRVRCRVKDNSGRWSHWSEPVQFAVGSNVSH